MPVFCMVSLDGSLGMMVRKGHHIFARGTMNAHIYCDDIIDAYVRHFVRDIDDDLLLQNHNARLQRTHRS